MVWVSSSSTRGGTPPYLGPYFAAKAAKDALAVSYAGELVRWGVETARPNVFICGAGARRGGAVSGIPGHNAARAVQQQTS